MADVTRTARGNAMQRRCSAADADDFDDRNAGTEILTVEPIITMQVSISLKACSPDETNSVCIGGKKSTCDRTFTRGSPVVHLLQITGALCVKPAMSNGNSETHHSSPPDPVPRLLTLPNTPPSF
jgi:hypothetical protein